MRQSFDFSQVLSWFVCFFTVYFYLTGQLPLLLWIQNCPCVTFKRMNEGRTTEKGWGWLITNEIWKTFFSLFSCSSSLCFVTPFKYMTFAVSAQLKHHFKPFSLKEEDSGARLTRIVMRILTDVWEVVFVGHDLIFFLSWSIFMIRNYPTLSITLLLLPTIFFTQIYPWSESFVKLFFSLPLLRLILCTFIVCFLEQKHLSYSFIRKIHSRVVLAILYPFPSQSLYTFDAEFLALIWSKGGK